MKLICGKCERSFAVRVDDLEGVDVDGKHDLTYPFCGARELTAAAPDVRRRKREERATWGACG